MAWPLRIASPGAFYHVSARGNERRAVFKSIRDRQKFVEYLETATERYNALIHAYCLKEVTALVLLGSQDFIEFIKNTYLSDKKPVRDVARNKTACSRNYLSGDS